jgi:hypothetical protein
VLHLIVAREDGSLEIYHVDEKAQRDLVFSAKEQETITGIAYGHITSS